MANYSLGRKPLPEVKDGHVFRGDNFLQAIPHTKIFGGVNGLRFINCNLTNCDIPADAVCEGCAPQHAEFCSNLHPRWVDKGLAQCTANCSHVTQTDTISIDGQVIAINYQYQDRRVA